jgi:hypothetical protein
VQDVTSSCYATGAWVCDCICLYGVCSTGVCDCSCLCSLAPACSVVQTGNHCAWTSCLTILRAR